MSPHELDLQGCPELNELGQERLVEGVDLLLETYADGDHVVGPAWLRVRIDEQALARLERYRATCRAEAAGSEFAVPAAPRDVAKGDVPISCWRLVCDSTHFWYQGSSARGVGVRSRPLALRTLGEALNAPPTALDETDAEEVAVWYGGWLIFHGGESNAGVPVVEFLEMLGEDFPEVQARERELRMADVMDQAAPGPVAKAAPRRRRL